VRFGTGSADQLEQGVGVIASVGNDVAAFEASQQLRGRTQVVSLSGGQQEADR